MLSVLVLTGALGVIRAGLCDGFVRISEDRIRNSLVAVFGSSHTVASPIAPIAWTGAGPLVFDGLPVERGLKVELKFRSDSGLVPVQITIDGRSAHQLEIGPAWRTHEFWLREDGDSLAAIQPEAPAVPIHIARVKISNVLHYSEGLFEAWIVRKDQIHAPAETRATWLPLVLGLAAMVAVIVWLSIGSGSSVSAVRGFGLWVGAAVVGLALTRLVVAASGYLLILTPQTAASVMVVPWLASRFWPQIRGAVAISTRTLLDSPFLRLTLAVSGVVAGWTLILWTLTMGPFDGDARAVARFGSQFPVPAVLEDVMEYSTSGYDGQFYSVISTDPLLRDQVTLECLDNPSYRAARGFLPMLSWLSVAGSSAHAPYAYVAWCWILGLAGPFLALVWLRGAPFQLSLFIALAMNGGLVVSVTRATPDAAAVTLILVALFVASRPGATSATAFAGGLAVVARETSVLAVPGMAWPAIVERRWIRAALILGTPVAALVSWRIYVRSATERGVGEAWKNFGPPLGWLPSKVHRMVADGWDPGAIEWTGVAWVLLCISCAASYLFWRREISPVLVSLVLFSGLAMVLNMLVFVEAFAFTRVLMVLPYLAALLVPGEQRRWRRVLLMSIVGLAACQGWLLLEFEWDHWQHGL